MVSAALPLLDSLRGSICTTLAGPGEEGEEGDPVWEPLGELLLNFVANFRGNCCLIWTLGTTFYRNQQGIKNIRIFCYCIVPTWSILTGCNKSGQQTEIIIRKCCIKPLSLKLQGRNRKNTAFSFTFGTFNESFTCNLLLRRHFMSFFNTFSSIGTLTGRKVRVPSWNLKVNLTTTYCINQPASKGGWSVAVWGRFSGVS